MQNTLELRRYTSEDKETVLRLHVHALQDTGVYLGRGPWDDDLDHIEDIYLRGGEFLVALLDRKIIGMGALKYIGPDRGELKRMRVDPEFQRRGFGQMILDRLEERARELGFRILQLDTGTLQVAAQKMYENNGYKEIRREERGKFMLIFYEKNLV